MKTHNNFPSKPSTIVLAIAASCIAASAFAAPLAKRADYADKIYTEYADSSDDNMSFDLNVVAQGKLKDLAGKKFSDLIGTPQRKLTATDDGFVTASHAFQNIQPNSAELDVLNKTVADFEAVGFPVAEGKYRILDVITTMGRDVSSHKAIEFCWKKQFHCVLLDPSIEFIDSIANNRIKLMAEGAGPKVTTVASGATEGAASLAGVCGLASNHAIKQRTVTYSARNIKYRNVFGNVLVNKDLGGQQSGVSCDTSCKPKPYGYSNVSSAQGYLGWRTACANNSGLGITGTTAKFIGKTMCTHKYAFAASASISVLNYGTAGVDLKVDVGGSVDATGGYVYESCGYF